MSFLRDRSPVTPKITRPQGPAIRGRRLSRSSRSGLPLAACHEFVGVTSFQLLHQHCLSGCAEDSLDTFDPLGAIAQVQAQHGPASTWASPVACAAISCPKVN